MQTQLPARRVDLSSDNHKDTEIELLRSWFNNQWGTTDPIHADGCPPPILASTGGHLVGGLSFTKSTKPESEERATWINALYVEPDSRGLGIGSLLIQEAERLASAANIDELYVFTELPKLYERLNWVLLTKEQNGYVLQKDLASGA